MDYHRGTLYASLVDRYIRDQLALEGRSEKYTEAYLEQLKLAEAVDSSGVKDLRRSKYEMLRRQYDITPWITCMLHALKDIVDAKKLSESAEFSIHDKLDLSSIMTGMEHLKINYVASAEEWGDPLPLVDIGNWFLANEYFGSLIDYLNFVYRNEDFTILSHKIFVQAYDQSLRSIHPKFETTPPSQRYRFLGPLMASREDIRIHNDLFIWMIIQLAVRPSDPDRFLEDYQDVFLDYHDEWVEREFAKLGVYDECSLIDLLSDPSYSYHTGVYRLHPICQLSPALRTKPLAHIVDYYASADDGADFDDNGDTAYQHAKEAAHHRYDKSSTISILF